MDQSMEELVKKAIAGDQMAISDLYDKTANRAYYFALEMVKDEDMAEDILQDSYVKAFSSLNTLSDPSKFQSWFNSIVVNTSKNYLKKKTPMLFSQMATTDDEGEEQEVDFVDESEEFSPEATVDYSETKRLIHEMIDNLPDAQRTAIILCYMEDYSVKQIAGIMECSEGTVKSRLKRGRDKIEKDVLDLEKKGTKLYCAPLAGFLLWMFHTSDTYVATAGVGAAAGSVAAVKNAVESTNTITEGITSAEPSAEAAGQAVTSATMSGSFAGAEETAEKGIIGLSQKEAPSAVVNIAEQATKTAVNKTAGGILTKAAAGLAATSTTAKVAAAVVVATVAIGGTAIGINTISGSDDTSTAVDNSTVMTQEAVVNDGEGNASTALSMIFKRGGFSEDTEPEENIIIEETEPAEETIPIEEIVLTDDAEEDDTEDIYSYCQSLLDQIPEDAFDELWDLGLNDVAELYYEIALGFFIRDGYDYTYVTSPAAILLRTYEGEDGIPYTNALFVFLEAVDGYSRKGFPDSAYEWFVGYDLEYSNGILSYSHYYHGESDYDDSVGIFFENSHGITCYIEGFKSIKTIEQHFFRSSDPVLAERWIYLEDN